MQTPAGEGEHEKYLLEPPEVDESDKEPLAERIHYLGIDSVRWYVNDQRNFLYNKDASGTIKIGLGDETYEVGLGKYQLKGGARTAPVHDRAVLPNRVYRGGKLTLKVFVRAIKSDRLHTKLLKDMSLASLTVVAGAVSAATASGPLAALLEAGKSLTGGIEEILKQGEKGKTVFDPGGVDITIGRDQIRGPETYLLVHRGARLLEDKLKLGGTSSNIRVLYEGRRLDDGAWVLFRLRRATRYGYARPWYRDEVAVRGELDDLMSRWRLGGVTADQVHEQLTPRPGEKNLGNRILEVTGQIGKDPVLSYAESSVRKSALELPLKIALISVTAEDPSVYDAERDRMVSSLVEGRRPPGPVAEAIKAIAIDLAEDKTANLIDSDPAIAAPFHGEELWPLFRQVGGKAIWTPEPEEFLDSGQ